MSGARLLVLLILPSFVIGCASAAVSRYSKEVTPVTYTTLEGARMERSVGKLRRLAVLPVQLEVSPENPKGCFGECGWVGLACLVRTEAAGFLHDRRGYEIISLESLEKNGMLLFSPEDLSAYTKILSDYARDGDPEQPPSEVVALTKELGYRAGLDGIVVVQGTATSLNIADWAVLYASFTLSFPLSFMRIGVSLQADVFEVATGRDVWTGTLTVGGEPNSNWHYGLMLFDPIEPAIPRALIQPP